MDEDLIFDKDDDIIIEDNKITLIKSNPHDLSKKMMKNLKELNGTWKIEFDSSSPKTPTLFTEQDRWISNNQDNIMSIYEELIDKSYYNDIFTKLTFDKLCDYLEDSRGYKRKYDVNIDDFKMYGLKNPSVEEWAMFYRSDILFLFANYRAYNFGTLYDFINFCYENSHTEKLPEY